MKRAFRKTLSLILCLVLLISAVVCVPASATDEAPGTDIPLIYVVGQGTALFRNEDGETKQIYPISIPDRFIEESVKANIGIFAKAVITQEWEEFGEAMRGILNELFGQLALDENGKPTDGSYCFHEWDNVWIDTSKTNGKYRTEQFDFFYDFRRDPCELAEDLHGYIERVMAATGADHVALLGRCLGGCITAAYMKMYDGEYVSDCIQYCSALKGATPCSKMFAGDVYLDADGIERFIYDLNLSADEITNELIQSFVTLFNKTYGLDLTCWAVNNVWEDIYLDIMPNMMLDTFGTWPGFWAMVDDNDYIRAKNNVFHNADMDKWAGFIEKIDNYHYNIQNKVEEDFPRYAENGVEMYNISKYGFQTFPVNAPSDMISDSLCELSCMSLGATTATLNTTFDAAYVANAKANDTYKYIAPDLQVDASTCLFPDRTWIIKNISHKNFPTTIDTLIDMTVNVDGLTVDTDERYPQFMVYLDNEIVPMVSENQNTTERYHHTFWDALKTFIRCLKVVIGNLIESKKEVA